MFVQMMQIDGFRGDVTDISAKTKPLNTIRCSLTTQQAKQSDMSCPKVSCHTGLDHAVILNMHDRHDISFKVAEAITTSKHTVGHSATWHHYVHVHERTHSLFSIKRRLFARVCPSFSIWNVAQLLALGASCCAFVMCICKGLGLPQPSESVRKSSTVGKLASEVK